MLTGGNRREPLRGARCDPGAISRVRGAVAKVRPPCCPNVVVQQACPARLVEGGIPTETKTTMWGRHGGSGARAVIRLKQLALAPLTGSLPTRWWCLCSIPSDDAPRPAVSSRSRATTYLGAGMIASRGLHLCAWAWTRALPPTTRSIARNPAGQPWICFPRRWSIATPKTAAVAHRRTNTSMAFTGSCRSTASRATTSWRAPTALVAGCRSPTA